MRTTNLLAPVLSVLVACSRPVPTGRGAGGGQAPRDASETGEAQAPLDAGSDGSPEPPCPPSIGVAEEPDGGAGTTRHTLPFGRPGEALTEPTPRAVEDVPVGKASEVKAQAELSRGAAAGRHEHDEWFFDAFDRESLFFFAARYEPNRRGGRPSGTYTILRRYRVRRSREAELALGVDADVARYEVGVCGIKAGMTRAEVQRILGAPTRTEALGPVFAFDDFYPGLIVRFLNSKVALVTRVDPARER